MSTWRGGVECSVKAFWKKSFRFDVFEYMRPSSPSLLADVTRGREELRRLFCLGRIDLIPKDGGSYVARSQILQLVLLTSPPSEANQGGRNGNHEVSRYSAIGCAGRI